MKIALSISISIGEGEHNYTDRLGQTKKQALNVQEMASQARLF